MRWTGVFFAAVLLTALCVPEARAHGGSFGHGPPGPRRAPNIPCDCARVACARCSADGLAGGIGLSKRETKLDVVESWGALARVRITAELATEQQSRFLEGFVEVRSAPLLAVTGGAVRSGDHGLLALLAPSRRARRDYLWERNRSLRDPLLVQRQDEATVHVRVFPIAKDVRTKVTLEAYTLLPAEPVPGGRVYRHGDHCLLVRPLTKETEATADVVDEAGGRVLRFLLRTTCRRLCPDVLARAVELPNGRVLRSLCCAAFAKGDAAVSETTALAALPPGRRAPANLFVGRRQDAPMIQPPGPPSLREPVDPTPPPSPPPPPASPTPPTAAATQG